MSRDVAPRILRRASVDYSYGREFSNSRQKGDVWKGPFGLQAGEGFSLGCSLVVADEGIDISIDVAITAVTAVL